jgi:dienelactone hydrolase
VAKILACSRPGPAGVKGVSLHLFSLCVAAAFFVFSAHGGQTGHPGKNEVLIRGRVQHLYYFPAGGATLHPDLCILFAPGDGGWRGAAIGMAERMASSGYDVYGLDTKQYLEGLSDPSSVRSNDVMVDFQQLSGWLVSGKARHVALVGWSEGAGLMVLAAASSEGRKYFRGLITMGLGDSNVLGWSWLDDVTYVTKTEPREPTFSALSFMDKISPLPLVMLQSNRDEYVPIEEAQRLFERAREPKKFVLIEAQNHRFDGNQEEFYRRLLEALRWVGGEK